MIDTTDTLIFKSIVEGLKFLGHDLEPFEWMGLYYRTECRKCGMMVCYDPVDSDVWNDAALKQCPKKAVAVASP